MPKQLLIVLCLLLTACGEMNSGVDCGCPPIIRQDLSRVSPVTADGQPGFVQAEARVLASNGELLFSNSNPDANGERLIIPANTLFIKNFLPETGDYQFISVLKDANNQVLGFAETQQSINDDSRILLPATGLLGSLTLNGVNTAKEGDSVTLELSASPPQRTDLFLLEEDFTEPLYQLTADGQPLIPDSSDKSGVTFTMPCAEVVVKVQSSGFTAIQEVGNGEIRVSSGDANTEFIVALESCVTDPPNSGGLVDFIPPTLTLNPAQVQVLNQDVEVLISGSVFDNQSGLNRVDIFEGVRFLGTATLDRNVTPNTWQFLYRLEDLAYLSVIDQTLFAIAYDRGGNKIELNQNIQATVQPPAWLDLSCGQEGFLRFNLGVFDDSANAIAIDSQQRIVLAGYSLTAGSGLNSAVIRLTPDCEPDNTFGGAGLDGRLLFAWDSLDDAVLGIQMLNNDSLSLAGFIRQNASIFQLTQEGRIDTNFGRGNLFTYQDTLVGNNDRFYAITGNNQGLLAVGQGGNQGIIASVASNGAKAADRLRVTTSDLGFSEGSFRAVLSDAQGGFLVAGQLNNQAAALKFSADGSLDANFGQQGLYQSGLVGSFYDLVADANGRYLFIGDSQNQTVVQRLFGNGVIDKGFANNGLYQINRPEQNQGRSIKIDSQGRIYLAAQQVNSGSSSDFLVQRLSAAGQLDVSFGEQGEVIFDFSGGNDRLNALTLQNDRPVAVGSSNGNIVLLRLLP